ncbi:hypothetical protein Scep_025410 [Stephania cephalantha]|uniref:Uncharacterized protein n=1 Tax=Stephania cephalantha TaxID=152367 RepID=A0AAP0EI68_9MAGN
MLLLSMILKAHRMHDDSVTMEKFENVDYNELGFVPHIYGLLTGQFLGEFLWFCCFWEILIENGIREAVKLSTAAADQIVDELMAAAADQIVDELMAAVGVVVVPHHQPPKLIPSSQSSLDHPPHHHQIVAADHHGRAS